MARTWWQQLFSYCSGDHANAVQPEHSTLPAMTEAPKPQYQPFPGFFGTSGLVPTTSFENPVTIRISCPSSYSDVVWYPNNTITMTDEAWSYIHALRPNTPVSSGFTTGFFEDQRVSYASERHPIMEIKAKGSEWLGSGIIHTVEGRDAGDKNYVVIASRWNDKGNGVWRFNKVEADRAIQIRSDWNAVDIGSTPSQIIMFYA
ncbi:hypothetical protein HDV00_008434 [Rhizophlyctis rosea]|nr:hypothetical protein HDV00_008434 [Rhizophlyctis rosea]